MNITNFILTFPAVLIAIYTIGYKYMWIDKTKSPLLIRRKGPKKMFGPIVINLLCFSLMVEVFSIIILLLIHGFIPNFNFFLFLIFPFILQSIINIIAFYAYYMRKQAFSVKEYIFASFVGSTVMFFYFAWVEIQNLI